MRGSTLLKVSHNVHNVRAEPPPVSAHPSKLPAHPTIPNRPWAESDLLGHLV